MNMKESGEMYLESILVLSEEQKNVRSVDICRYMHYSRPSVSRAVGLLKDEGYITVDEEGYICLTETGRCSHARCGMHRQRPSPRRRRA